jgi:hypothetical protein
MEELSLSQWDLNAEVTQDLHLGLVHMDHVHQHIQQRVMKDQVEDTQDVHQETELNLVVLDSALAQPEELVETLECEAQLRDQKGH